jgi:hypothetical protein
MERRERWWTAAGAAALVVGFFLWMWFQPGGAKVTLIVSDAVAITISSLAGVACLHAAHRSEGRPRRGWILLGAGMFSWSLGEAIWSSYEVVLGREVPFPSLADIGYLGMVPLALVGVATLVTVERKLANERNAVRAILDGLIISGSLLYLSWATVLGPAYRISGQTRTDWIVSLAYPVSDVVIASIVFVLLSQADRRQRTPLTLIGVGLLALAVADSGFAYLVQSGDYNSGDLIDTAWIAGFALIVLAGLWAPGTPAVREAPGRAAVPAARRRAGAVGDHPGRGGFGRPVPLLHRARAGRAGRAAAARGAAGQPRADPAAQPDRP